MGLLHRDPSEASSSSSSTARSPYPQQSPVVGAPGSPKLPAAAAHERVAAGITTPHVSGNTAHSAYAADGAWPPSAPPSRPSSRQSSRPSSRQSSRVDLHRADATGAAPTSSNGHTSASSSGKMGSPPPSSVGGTAKPPRFEVLNSGTPEETHAHHLRPARRQEKLGKMLKDLFRVHHQTVNGNGKASDEGDEMDREAEDAVAAVMAAAAESPSAGNKQPPSLLSGLVRELKQNNRDPGIVLDELLSARSKQVGGSNFSERYGRLSDVVGKGSFGVVRLAHKVNPADKRRKLIYAVKEYHPNQGEGENQYLKRLASEFCLSSSLHHPNIIHSLDLLRDSRNRYCGVMEYCAGGDLYSLIVVAGKLLPLESDCYFKQIMRGVAYMHDMGVAHRDLKPENILLTSRGCVKITDFGNAECFRMAWEQEIHLASNLCGSGPYIAPEEYTKSEFDPRAVDVWSVGVIYMAMRTGQQLWQQAKSSDEFYARYLRGRKDANGYEPIERLQHARCRNVVYSVLDPVSSRRLTARQTLNSEWGRSIHVCEAGEGKRYDEEAHHCPPLGSKQSSAATTLRASSATPSTTPVPSQSPPQSHATSPPPAQMPAR